MAKDPAFLFYSKDFYEGTRMMLPEERACYIDLLIYQHQNGIIPNDLKRVAMYCSGINEAILQATLQAKFKQTNEGWLNLKLEKVQSERKEFSEKQSVNGSVGQFWKKAKAILNGKEYIKLKENLFNYTNNQLVEIIKDKIIDKAMLIAMLKHLAIEDVIANEDVIAIKKKTPKLFKDSEYFDIQVLTEALAKSKPPYCEAHVGYYYEAMELWSKQGNKKIDWFATCQTFILRDVTENKFKDKNFKPTNGKSNNGLTEIQKRRIEIEQEIANQTE